MLATAMETWKRLNVKFRLENECSDWAFNVTAAEADS